MNIFYLDRDVTKCAEAHIDKHVHKMILEGAQLLCTAHRVLDGICIDGFSDTGRKQKQWILNDKNRNASMYKATHINHPSAKWVRESKENYLWLYSLLVALSKEYTHRYCKIYKIFRTELGTLLSNTPENIVSKPFTEPTLAMPDEYKQPDHVLAYRAYYVGHKLKIATYKNRIPPDWMNL